MTALADVIGPIYLLLAVLGFGIGAGLSVVWAVRELWPVLRYRYRRFRVRRDAEVRAVLDGYEAAQAARASLRVMRGRVIW